MKTLVTLAFFLGAAGVAHSASVDVDVQAAANKLLASLGPQVTTVVTTKHIHTDPVCHVVLRSGGDYPTVCLGGGDKDVQTTTKSNAILTASNVVVTGNGFNFNASPVIAGTPYEGAADRTVITNCTSVQQSNHIALTWSKQTSAQISLQNTVSNTSTTNLGFKLPFGKGGPEISGGVSFGNTESSTNARVDGSQETTTLQKTDDIFVPPHSAVTAVLLVYHETQDWPFNAVLVADADVSANDAGIRKLSDKFGVQDRTFSTSGVLEVAQATEARVAYYQKDLAAADCTEAAAPALTSRLANAAGTAELGRKIVAAKVKPKR